MSISSDAILFFGIIPDADMLPADVDLFKLADDFTVLCSPPKPTSEDLNDAAWAAWRKKNAEFKRLGVGVTCGIFCSSSDPITYIALEALCYVAFRGSVVTINPAKMEPTAKQIASLREFCDEAGVQWTEPGWHMVSYFG